MAALGALLWGASLGVGLLNSLRRALTPSATVGPVGHAYINSAIARLLGPRDGFARAVSHFVLTTIIRNRAPQTPIAMNAGIGVALVALSLARQRGDATTALLAAPLMIAFWTVVGLRAAFFVPSELSAAWTFLIKAPPRFASYARGVRAAIVGLIAPPVVIAAFLPFSRPYRPGYAKLKTRWPLYAAGAYAFAYGSMRVPLAVVAVAAVALELTVGRFARRRWKLVPRADQVADDAAVISLDLIGDPDLDVGIAVDLPDEPRQPLLPGTLADVRHAVRLLHRDRVFSAVAVSTIALAVGANVTLFTIVNGMGGRPKIADETRAVVLSTVYRAGQQGPVSYADFQDWRTRTRTMSELAAYRSAGITLTDRGLAAERATGAYISAETFRLIGERPILGRDFLLSDDRPGAEPVVILGGGLWRARYGADPAIVGRTIRANGVDRTVIGVMRPGFRFPLVHDVWLPLASAPGVINERRDLRTLQILGRLRTGVSIDQAGADFAAASAALSQAYPETNRELRAAVSGYAERFTIANPWNAMLIAVSFVLIIGCANIANLLLSRGARRANEFAIRRSIGATRWQLIRQLLIEHAIIAASAGAIGFVVGLAGVRIWVMSLPVANWPYWYDFTLNQQVFGYLFAIVVACVVLFGVGPAIATSKTTPTTGERRFRTNALLVVQMTLTLALLAGAGLLARTLGAVYRADAVVDTADVVFATIDLPPERFKTAQERLVLFRHLDDRLAASPDVEAATLASTPPFYDAPLRTVEIDGHSNDASAPVATSYVAIGPRYFETLRLKLPRGRAFTNADGGPGHDTVIVNERFVSMYLPNRDPIGHRIRLTDPRDPSAGRAWLTIVGVSPMVRQHYGQDFDPVVYVPYRANPAATMVLMARSARAGVPIASTLRSELSSIDAELPLVNVMALDQLLAGTRFANEAWATMFTAFAAIALLLAAIGLHGVTAYAVTRRTREIGIRVALGSPASTVTWMFVRRVLPALVMGVVLGMGAAIGVGQLVKSTLAGTSPHDPATLVTITVVLVAVALASTLVPARRAAMLDPTTALRHD